MFRNSVNSPYSRLATLSQPPSCRESEMAVYHETLHMVFAPCNVAHCFWVPALIHLRGVAKITLLVVRRRDNGYAVVIRADAGK